MAITKKSLISSSAPKFSKTAGSNVANLAAATKLQTASNKLNPTSNKLLPTSRMY